MSPRLKDHFVGISRLNPKMVQFDPFKLGFFFFSFFSESLKFSINLDFTHKYRFLSKSFSNQSRLVIF